MPGLSCPHGHWGKAHILSFGFRLPDEKCSTQQCDKDRSQTGRGQEACGSQGTGDGGAGVVTWPIFTLGPLFLSWALITQRPEATPEPGGTLCEKSLVQCQCHFNRKVGSLGCAGSPFPGAFPNPRDIGQRPPCCFTRLSSEGTTYAHSSETPRDPVRGWF